MQLSSVNPISKYTTLKLGGTPRSLLEVTTEAQLIDAVAAVGWSHLESDQLLLVAGGSNLVVADGQLAMDTVVVHTNGIDECDGDNDADGTETALVTVQAGEQWQSVVDYAVACGLSGIECLSGIPGTAGATPVQNVGAYGQEVSSVIAAVRVYDRETRQISELQNAECEFVYRSSRFKRNPRYVVLAVTFVLRRETLSAPLTYNDLLAELDCEHGARLPLKTVAEAVKAVRSRKGMVVNQDDPDTQSAGSFFTNPQIPASQAEALLKTAQNEFGVDHGLRLLPVTGDDSLRKLSAAWLIEHSGFKKGFAVGQGAQLSSKHTLALTTRGGTTDDLLLLARTVRDGVASKFGVQLEPEPVFVGCEL